MATIRVLWVGSHTLLQQRLCAYLAECADIIVLGQWADGPKPAQKARELEAHVAVLHIAARPASALETARCILSYCPECRILVVSQNEDNDTILSAMQAGVSGYLFKQVTGPELAQAIRAVVQGGMVLDPQAARIVVDAYLCCEFIPGDDQPDCLTDREREILILVAEGYTNQHISELLHISPKTVDTHRTNLMGKLDLHSGREVVKYALRRRLIDL